MRFLKARDKVKVTIMFRGREMAHPERGEMILNRLAEELGELAVVEQRPQQDGRNMTMMLAPTRQATEAGGAPEGGEPRRRRSQRRHRALPRRQSPGPRRRREGRRGSGARGRAGRARGGRARDARAGGGGGRDARARGCSGRVRA